MDKQKQIEEMERDVANAGKIAGDWLMEEAKKLLQENGRFKSTEHTRTLSDIVAEELAKMGYRKIPENAVVLTGEEWAEHCEQFAKAMYQKEVNVHKETAEKFAERLVEKAFVEFTDDDYDRLCFLVGEIAKELIGGKNNATSRNIKTEE